MKRTHKFYKTHKYNVAQVSFYQVSKSFKTNSATNLTKVFKIYVCLKLEYNTQMIIHI